LGKTHFLGVALAVRPPPSDSQPRLNLAKPARHRFHDQKYFLGQKAALVGTVVQIS
jgi:hypothetical protein